MRYATRDGRNCRQSGSDRPFALSTLHTNDSIATITRLSNMGVPAFMISAALSLVVAQRLARKNCPDCLVPDTTATESSMEYIGFTAEEIGSFQPMRGGGCATCEGSGYKGRRAFTKSCG